MRRRELITLGGTSVLWCGLAHGQLSPRRRIAMIAPSRPVEDLKTHPYYRSFLDELNGQGFVEGENLVVDRYSAHGDATTYGELARKVVASRPEAIFTSGSQMVTQLKAATTSIPIVASVGDPVAFGLASSLAKPGTNLTGVTVDAGYELYGKRLALLLELNPGASVFGYLSSRFNWGRAMGAAVREAAHRANILLRHIDLGTSFSDAAYAAAFGSIEKSDAAALLVSDEPEHLSSTSTLVDLAASVRIPTMHPFRDLVVAGGLMSYHIDLFETFRYAGNQVAQILRGKNPAEMPFYQPTKFQFIINMKTAQRIGLELPVSVLARADEVIE